MVIPSLLSVEEFYQRREELPEEGRWCELVQGRVVELTPPDVLHSGVVLNMAKALAAYAHQTQIGYACFDLGIVVARNPDTVRLASIAYFLEGPRFEFSDQGYCDRAPDLVVNVVSSVDRAHSMPQRVREYLALGVPLVWLLDPTRELVQVHRRAAERRVLTSDAMLSGEDVLSEFVCAVGPLFDVPRW